jgi:hypothetical protein
MERVAFLIESTGDRLGCLLNPESLVIRRSAGVRSRRSAGGQLTGSGLADDPLLFTGGGRTEIELELLFDISLIGSTIQTEDVRDLTSPLWDLSENAVEDDGVGRPTLARFVWGKSWNIPGIVEAVAERLENFTPDGTARRSWLKMRFVRVGEPIRPIPRPANLPGATELRVEDLVDLPPDQFRVREASGGEGEASGQRLDNFLFDNGIDPRHWKPIAADNGIDNPMNIPPGSVLRLPPPSLLGGSQ